MGPGAECAARDDPPDRVHAALHGPCPRERRGGIRAPRPHRAVAARQGAGALVSGRPPRGDDPQHPTSTRVVAGGLEVPGALIAATGLRSTREHRGRRRRTTSMSCRSPSPATPPPSPGVRSCSCRAWSPTDFATRARARGEGGSELLDPPLRSGCRRSTSSIPRRSSTPRSGSHSPTSSHAAVYLTHMDDLPAVDWVWRRYFPERSARTRRLSLRRTRNPRGQDRDQHDCAAQ